MRVVDLFCGLGGSSLGVRQAGHEVVGACDVCPMALETYRLNHGDHAVQMDVRDTAKVLTWLRALRPDCIVASPPCTSFSTAGCNRRDCDLALITAQLATQVKVRHLVFENVRQMLSSQSWKAARTLLESAGYSVAVLKLKASHFGVPQKRMRVFVVCTLSGSAEQARTLERRARDMSTRRETTMRDVFPHMQTYFQWGCYKMPHIHST